MDAHLDTKETGRNLSWRAGTRELSTQQLLDRYLDSATTMVDLGRLRVRVRDEGSGLPIVLIHGTAASLETWDGWARELSKSFRVLRFDLPGFGLTGPDPESHYEISQHVQTLRALLVTLGIERAVIGGNSLGGQIACHFAATHPECVHALVLVSPAGFNRHAPGPFAPLRSKLVRALFRRMAPRVLTLGGLAAAYGNPFGVSSDIVDRYQDMLLRPGNRDALTRSIAIAPDHALTTQVLARISAPTLLLWGKRDRLTRFVESERFVALLAQATLRAYEHLGHVAQEEAPEESAHDVVTFLQALGT